MDKQTAAHALTGEEARIEHLDVLIVGAGMSGIGSAVHLTRQSPWASFAILDAFDGHGGTWWSNVYPGARSDSDLFTYGFSFKPWEGAPLARGEPIKQYMGEVIAEYDLAERIRYRHKVVRADWSTEHAHWTVTAERDNGETVTLRANFLWMCQGYYRHLEGFTPDWPGMDTFRGDIIHPQRWPEGYDYAGKRVVVIGSGATAATVVPAMADAAAHVVQLQRSPTYYVAAPNEYPLATQLRRLDIPREWIHEIVRKQIQLEHEDFIAKCLATPDDAARDLLAGVNQALDGKMTDDFVPTYKPWRQRICAVPDGDFFNAIKEGKASVVTDEIDAFVPEGIRLKSGRVLEADLIVTATGFNVSAFGDIEITKDDAPFDMTKTVTYRGMMFTDTPNFAWIIGYFRAGSYTLRIDVVGELVCRMLNTMREKGLRTVTPQLREEDRDMELRPYFHTDEFNAGYVERAAAIMPRSGTKALWRHSQDYHADRTEFPAIDFDQEPLAFR
ncbi:flavin-containing monooxygenase [Zavarzinia sp. CC-PAN008]|uniref:flavin-containing monooxygenase n=1 Tax=Zavarzinia sp. CC-PAN008 TaxID=3243332 RepID=UPI003F747F06